MQPSLAMGGYAGYLLIAYSVTAVVVIGNIVAARRRFRRTRRRLSDLLARRAGRPGPAAAGGNKTGDQMSKQNGSATTVGRQS